MYLEIKDSRNVMPNLWGYINVSINVSPLPTFFQGITIKDNILEPGKG